MTEQPHAVARVTLVSGNEELLVDRAVGRVVEAVRRESPDAEVHRLEAGGLEPGTLRGVASPSLFGDRTVVAIRRAHELGEELAGELVALVGEADAEVVWVLCHEGAANRGKAVVEAARAAGAAEVPAAAITKPSERLAFVVEEFRAQRRRIDDQAARALLEAVGDDLRGLASACSQLASDTEGTVDVEAVRRYHEGRADVTSFAVADRVVEGRTAEALGLLRHALQSGVAPVLVTSALAASLRGLVHVGSAPRGMSQGELARHAGLPPWKVDIVRRQVRGWDGEGLSVAIRAVAAADAEVKGAGGDPTYALERLVVTVTGSRRG